MFQEAKDGTKKDELRKKFSEETFLRKETLGNHDDLEESVLSEIPSKVNDLPTTRDTTESESDTKTSDKSSEPDMDKNYTTKTKEVESKIGPVNLIDDNLPDMLHKHHNMDQSQTKGNLPSINQCKGQKKINWGVFTSTWLSVSAKDIDIREFLGKHPKRDTKESSHDIYHRDLDDNDDEIDELKDRIGKNAQPYCSEVPTSLRIPDHLEGIKMRKYLHMASEPGLKEAFQGIQI